MESMVLGKRHTEIHIRTMDDLDLKNIHDLKILAKECGFARARYAKLRKSQLIHLLTTEKATPKSQQSIDEYKKKMFVTLFDEQMALLAEMQKRKTGHAHRIIARSEVYADDRLEKLANVLINERK